MKNVMGKFWTFAIDNFDTLTAILLSLTAGSYGIFWGTTASAKTTTILLSAIAITLALLSYSLIHDRKARAELQREIKLLQHGPSIDTLLLDRIAYAPLLETISSARNIYFLGPSLVNVFRESFKYLSEEKIKRHGANIQVLLLNPKSPALEAAALCIAEAIPERVEEDINSTLRYVKWISEQNITSGSIEARMMSVNPNLSMVILDPDEPTGRIFIEILGYQIPTSDRPHFELLQSRDRKWFSFFLNQYKKLWGDSTVVNF